MTCYAIKITKFGELIGWDCCAPGSDYAGCQTDMALPRLTAYLSREDAELRITGMQSIYGEHFNWQFEIVPAEVAA